LSGGISAESIDEVLHDADDAFAIIRGHGAQDRIEMFRECAIEARKELVPGGRELHTHNAPIRSAAYALDKLELFEAIDEASDRWLAAAHALRKDA